MRYQKPIYNAALRMLRDPEDARDVTQTTFLKAFARLDNFDPRFKFFSWLYRIAINESINLGERRPVFEALDENLEEPSPARPDSRALPADGDHR
ncbi:MAG: RNA polymerase sigma factor, partial [Pseudomonadales bacterium]